MRPYVEPIFRQLARQLSARYPGVRIASVSAPKTGDGEDQQAIEYRAPLETLKSSGLLTAEMLRRKDGTTSMGEGFFLYKDNDGDWSLTVFTGTAPRGRPHIGTLKAKQILSRIAAKAESA